MGSRDPQKFRRQRQSAKGQVMCFMHEPPVVSRMLVSSLANLSAQRLSLRGRKSTFGAFLKLMSSASSCSIRLQDKPVEN